MFKLNVYFPRPNTQAMTYKSVKSDLKCNLKEDLHRNYWLEIWNELFKLY